MLKRAITKGFISIKTEAKIIAISRELFLGLKILKSRVIASLDADGIMTSQRKNI